MPVNTSASISIKVNVDKGELAELKNELGAIGQAFDAAELKKRLEGVEAAVQGIDAAGAELKAHTTAVISTLEAGFERVTASQDGLTASTKDAVNGVKTEVKTIREKITALGQSVRAQTAAITAATERAAQERKVRAEERKAREEERRAAAEKKKEADEEKRAWADKVKAATAAIRQYSADNKRRKQEAAAAAAAEKRDWDSRLRAAGAAIRQYSANNRRRASEEKRSAAETAAAEKKAWAEKVRAATAAIRNYSANNRRREADEKRAAAASAAAEKKAWSEKVRAAAAAINQYSANNRRREADARRAAAAEKRDWDARVRAADAAIRKYSASKRRAATEEKRAAAEEERDWNRRLRAADAAIRAYSAGNKRRATDAKRASDAVAKAERDAARASEKAEKDNERAWKAWSADQRRAAADARRYANEMNKAMELRGAQHGIASVRQEIVELMNNVKAGTPAHVRLQNALNRIDTTGAKTTAQINALTGAMRREVAMAKESDRAWNGLSGRLAQFRERVSATERKVDAIFRASYRLQMVGSTFKFFAQNVMRIGIAFVEAFSEFEYMALRAQAAMSGVTISTRQFQGAVVDTTQELRMFEAKDVAEAMYYWGSTTGAVVDTQKDLAATMAQVTPIMQAASMTNTGYEAAIKGVYSILAQYNLGLDQTARVTEELFYVTQKTAAEFPDLINSFKMVGPVAASVGVSFDEVVQVFGDLADLGIRGTMSGRALRQFFIQTLRPAPKAIAALNELFAAQGALFDGKSYKDLMFPKGEFVGFTNYIENLAKATAKLSVTERIGLLAKISTANELPVLIALVSRYRGEMEKSAKVQRKLNLADSSMYFKRNWEMISNSAKGLLGMIRNIRQSIQFEFGRGITEVLLPVVQIVEELANKFRDWLSLNPEVVRMAATLGMIAVIAASVVAAVLTLAGVLVGVAAAFLLVVQMAGPAVAVFSYIGTVITVLSAALYKAKDSLIEVAGVIQKQLSGSFEAITDVITAFGEGFAGAFELASESIAVVIKGIGFFVAGVATIVSATNNAINASKEFAFVLELVAKGLGMLLATMALTRGLEALQAAIWMVTTAIRTMSVAATASKIALLTSPMFVLAAAMIAVGAALEWVIPIFQRYNYVMNEQDDAINANLKSLGKYRGSIEGVVRQFGEFAKKSAELDAIAQYNYDSKRGGKGFAGDLLDWYGDTFFGWIPMLTKGQYAGNVAKQAAKDYIDNTLKGFKDAYENINSSREAAGLSTIALDAFNSVLGLAFTHGIKSTYEIPGIGLLTSTIFDPKKVTEEVVNVVNGLEPFNPMDISAAYANFISKYSLADISQSEFYQMAVSLGRVGTDVERGRPELDAALKSVMDNITGMTADEMGKALKSVVGGRALVEWRDDPNVSQAAKDTINVLLSTYSSKLSEQSERFGDDIVGGMAKTITEAITLATQEALLIAIPELPDIVSRISADIVSNDPQSLADIMTALTEPLANGSTVIDAMRSGSIPDDIKNAIVDGLDYAVKQGALSADVVKEFHESIKEEASATGADVAETSITAILEGFYDNIGNRKEWLKSIREANKAGYLGKNISNILKFAQSDAFKHLPKTLFARTQADKTVTEKMAQMFDVVRNGPALQSGRALSRLLKFRPGKSSAGVRAFFKAQILALADEGLISLEQLGTVFPKEKQRRMQALLEEALRNGMFGGTGETDVTTLGPVNISAWLLGTSIATDAGKGLQSTEGSGQFQTAVKNVIEALSDPNSPTMASARSAGDAIGGAISKGITASLDGLNVLFGGVIVQPNTPQPPTHNPVIPTFGSGNSGSGSGGNDGTYRWGGKDVIIKREHQKVDIEVKVYSPDGSVDNVKTGELRRAVYDAMTIAPWTIGNLEYYGTIP